MVESSRLSRSRVFSSVLYRLYRLCRLCRLFPVSSVPTVPVPVVPPQLSRPEMFQPL